LFITILSHHFIAAIALGTVLRKGVSNIFVSGFFIISFAATIPVGVVIGIIVSTIQGQAFEIIHGISLAFTGGAFIYVASFEIMGHSRTKSKIVFALRTLMFMLGFAAMAVIANFG
jgi:zinc transporter ZupT